jgi:hypothetical protein
MTLLGGLKLLPVMGWGGAVELSIRMAGEVTVGPSSEAREASRSGGQAAPTCTF